MQPDPSGLPPRVFLKLAFELVERVPNRPLRILVLRVMLLEVEMRHTFVAHRKERTHVGGVADHQDLARDPQVDPNMERRTARSPSVRLLDEDATTRNPFEEPLKLARFLADQPFQRSRWEDVSV
jgi:hypothetical protein